MDRLKSEIKGMWCTVVSDNVGWINAREKLPHERASRINMATHKTTEVVVNVYYVDKNIGFSKDEYGILEREMIDCNFKCIWCDSSRNQLVKHSILGQHMLPDILGPSTTNDIPR